MTTRAALHAEREPAQVSAPTCSKTTSTPFFGELAHHALEAVFAIVDDVICAKRLGLLDLVVGTDCGMTVQPIFLASWIAAEPDAGNARPTRTVSPAQAWHCRTAYARPYRRLQVRRRHLWRPHRRCRTEQAGRQVHSLAGKAVEMETVYTADMFCTDCHDLLRQARQSPQVRAP